MYVASCSYITSRTKERGKTRPNNNGDEDGGDEGKNNTTNAH